MAFNKDEKSFRSIVLSHYEKILAISCEEFTGGYYNETFAGNNKVRTYVPDTRKKYIQSVNALNHSLTHLFDEKMKERYKMFKAAEKQLRKEFENKDGYISEENTNRHSIKHLRIAHTFFRDLVNLLGRLDYLKSDPRAEDEEDEEEEDGNA